MGVKFYFVTTNKLESKILQECGVRNTLISFAYMNNFNYDLSYLRQNFDRLFMDSGAFTILETGRKISMQDYIDQVKKQKGIPDIVAQFDAIGDLQKTIDNYKEMLRQGIDWSIPIVQQDWLRGIYEFEQLGVPLDYFGLGRHLYGYTHGVDIQRLARTMLPKKYKYHGFAKAYTYLIENKLVESVDSSSWSYVTRKRSSPYMTLTERGSLLFGRIGKDNRINVMRVWNNNRDECAACHLSLDALLEGRDDALYRAAIALFYRPWFKKLGMFEDNFRF